MREVTYTNPVYPEYFADPFVWKFEETYYAIGTGADDTSAVSGSVVSGSCAARLVPRTRAQIIGNGTVDAGRRIRDSC